MTDEQQIRELQALWGQRDADKDARGFSELYTEDGVFTNVTGRYEGRAAIRKNLEDRTARNPPDRRTTHVFGPSVVYVRGDEAEASTDYVAYGRVGSGPWAIMSAGRLHTRLVRVEGAWLFSSVENRSIGPSGGPSTHLLAESAR